MREVVSRVRLVVSRAQIWPHVEPVFDAADGERERAAAVSEGDTELRKPLEHTAEDHRADRERRLGWHTDEPGQPVFRHAFLSGHVPRMNEDGRAELLRGAPDRLQGRVVQVQSIDATEMRIGVDMRADLRATQSQLADTAFQFAGGQIRILQRNRCQAGESRRIIPDDFCDVIVQSPGKIERVGWLRPIAEHDRHGREHLH